jgi:hypothetical protein
MPPSQDERASSTERLLKGEYSSVRFDDEEGKASKFSKPTLFAKIWKLRVPALIHLAIFTIYTVGFALIAENATRICAHGPDYVNCNTRSPSSERFNILMFFIAPAQGVVRFSKQYIDNDVNKTSPFKGEPRPELDDAWASLFTCEYPCV